MARATQIVEFRITRFQFARDRTIGDSRISSDEIQLAALELIGADGKVGLGFLYSVAPSLPDEAEIDRVFGLEAWPERGAKRRGAGASPSHATGRQSQKNELPFEEAIQQAVWDLYAKASEMPLWELLGGTKKKVRVYASGLDFHLSDDDYRNLFARAVKDGHTAFKIKVGHRDVERDIHRLDVLKQTVGQDATVMVDANEAWTPKQTLRALDLFRKAGHEIYWIEIESSGRMSPD